MINPTSKSITIVALLQILVVWGAILFASLGDGLRNLDALGYEGSYTMSLISEFGFFLNIIPLAWMISTLYFSNKAGNTKLTITLYLAGVVILLLLSYLFLRALSYGLSPLFVGPCLLLN